MSNAGAHPALLATYFASSGSSSSGTHAALPKFHNVPGIWESRHCSDGHGSDKEGRGNGWRRSVLACSSSIVNTRRKQVSSLSRGHFEQSYGTALLAISDASQARNRWASRQGLHDQFGELPQAILGTGGVVRPQDEE